jgi:hypothetical protein
MKKIILKRCNSQDAYVAKEQREKCKETIENLVKSL